MKKFCFFIFAVVFIFSISACSNIENVDPTTSTNPEIQMPTDPTNSTEIIDPSASESSIKLEIKINDAIINLPCTYSEFKTITGLSVAHENVEVQGNSAAGTWIQEGQNIVLMVDVISPTGEPTIVANGIVASLKTANTQSNTLDFSVNDFSVGDIATEQDLSLTFGKPDRIAEKIFEDDPNENCFQYYWYLNENQSKYLEIQIYKNSSEIKEIYCRYQ